MKSLFIANRGEIAVRIARTAAEHGIRTYGVFTEEDRKSLHVSLVDEAFLLSKSGAAGYLAIDEVISLVKSSGTDAVHPGYGFLSENAEFAQAVEKAGATFVGPASDTLKKLGDKVEARCLAQNTGVPTLPGSAVLEIVDDAIQFFESLGAGASVVLKAVAGGGGRGMRVVHERDELEREFVRAQSEAQKAFGNGVLYAEQYLPSAKHIEVQIVGDGSGAVTHLYDRDCSLQRRHQKIIEVAPATSVSRLLREKMFEAATQIGVHTNYRGLGTVEFLVDVEAEEFYFIEVNPRLQVEHTVTEEVLGLDLVELQLALASKRTLQELGLSQLQVSEPKGHAVQVRINAEAMQPDGAIHPSAGMLDVFQMPTGPGIRVDTFAYAGMTVQPAFDSLIAKLICHSRSGDLAAALSKTSSALDELCIESVHTNTFFLKAILERISDAPDAATTRYIEDHLAVLLLKTEEALSGDIQISEHQERAALDPLAVLDHGKKIPAEAGKTAKSGAISAHDSHHFAEGAVTAPMQGTVVSVSVEPGDAVASGGLLLVVEAMKMEHEIRAEYGGIVQNIHVGEGATISEGQLLLLLAAQDVAGEATASAEAWDPEKIRPDLKKVLDRKAAGKDESRPEAVSKRREKNYRTARENIQDLCDEGTFVEYGATVVAAQRRRRKMDDLVANTSGDGLVCGLGHVNGNQFPAEKSRAMVLSYDYMVLAGTQGALNHYKKDRMFELAERLRLPTILFAEGGGGRPGDTDVSGVAGLDCHAFTYFAELSGLVPLVGVSNGYCFAGNAVLLSCCDVIIATEDSNIGIGGPAMIEGGGLGVFRPDEIGPMDVQVPNGVVDILVPDEATAVSAAKKYLSYFQGALSDWEEPDARFLRNIVPENRLRYYDMRRVVEGIADIGSVMELRKDWAIGIITCFARIEGKPVGIIANNPGHLSGAIDAPGADKAARFMQLCDAFDIPVLTLVDCPGIMVGPEIEKSAIVRHAGRLFAVGANVDIPVMSVVIRKGYGLGAQAMTGTSFKSPIFNVSWPTGEFGGMSLEGFVKLGFRKELQAIEDPAERRAAYDDMVAQAYERGGAINMASHFEIDDVIDPAETRKWISAALQAVPLPPQRTGKKRPFVDTW